MLRPLLAAALLATPTLAQTTAQAVLARLTTAEKAAQLMMCWSLSRTDDDYPRLHELREWIEEPGIGGVILSLGETADAVDLIADLQARSAIPLVVAGDFENGVGFRLDGATDLGPQMLLGATRSARLARLAGEVTGRETRAIGAHWDFAPVLDVNINPLNPIIQIRSFGADPQLVARLGVAWTKGIQSTGVLATGKHFPGHGDVSTDSHHELPVVPASRERLEQVELVPFRAAIAAGIGSMMTGHLSVGGLGVDPATPATLSPEILTGLLRKELGYDGLVVTDALDMGGLQSVTPVEAAVRALIAGADLLLMPPDPVATRDAVVAAVADGRVPASRLDEACLRVLQLKEEMGLLTGGGGIEPDWRAEVGRAEHEAVGEEIARRGITLLRDARGAVPLPATSTITLVTARAAKDGADAGRELAAELALHGASVQVHHVAADADDAAIAAAIAALEGAGARGEPRILALTHGRLGRVPATFEPLARALESTPGGIAILLGNPFAPRFAFRESAVIATYGLLPRLERAAARAVVGRAPITGRSPVDIPDLAVFGDGISVLPAGTDLGSASPVEEDCAPDLPARIRARLEAGVAEGAFPGAVAVVARRGRIIAEVAVGRATYGEDAAPVQLDSRFDLASLTKVCATTPAVLRLVDQGRLQLDTRVRDVLPGFAGSDREAIEVRHLLTHTAGLPPFVRFFETLDGRDAIVDACLRVPLQSSPGSTYRYSDIGMILLMAVVEKIAGEPFDAFVAREVFAPLGMASARFVRRGESLAGAMPTEKDDWRGRVVRGEVHDENAYAMGGVSGHAGLFADARDVTRLAQAFLGGGRGLARPDLVRRFVTRQELVPGSSRALGWDTFESGGSCGTRLAPTSFGHTGFTGTSVWCDPTRDLSIVLLTNRVHPTRDNKGHIAVRRELADLVAELIDG